MYLVDETVIETKMPSILFYTTSKRDAERQRKRETEKEVKRGRERNRETDI